MFEKEAEEYVEKKIDLATSMMNPQIETATRQGFKDGAEFGYNKGLEAGRPKWHDLRKNPDDLPPRKGLETYSERLITDKGYSVYNFRKCRWYVDEPDCDCMVHREVVAWTEIPVFEEADNA